MDLKKTIIFIILSFLYLVSCKKKDRMEDVTVHAPIENVQILNISESECSVHWNAYPEDLTKVSIELSENEFFSSATINFALADAGQSYFKIEKLKEVTTYFLRIKAVKKDGSVYTTANVTFRTGCITTKLFVTTVDGFKIETTIMYTDSGSSLKPCIIFLHELGKGKSWDHKDIVLDFVAKGYVCVLFNFRGHGGSTPVADLGQLLTDKSLVAKDLDAVFRYMKTDKHIDSTRFGLIGASLGATMAVAGNGYTGVKASVALSGLEDGIYTLFPGMHLSATLYVAGEKDFSGSLNVDFAKDAQYMYNQTDNPKKIIIVPGSQFHGTELLKVAGINEEIVNWISTML
jgi:dienelactone hydrolase